MLILFSSCKSQASQNLAEPSEQPLKVLASVSFLTDITQQVAGDRLIVDTLIPPGLDPHAYEPTPRDLAKIASTDLMVLNGAGLEGWLAGVIQNISMQGKIVEASQGLPNRVSATEVTGENLNPDPHFWLDPNLVEKYVINIRDGLIKADPAGEEQYTSNAEAYIIKLRELNQWIEQEVDQIPPGRRILVTNHDSFGYFADRYGFKIIGTIIPSVSTDASPSAQHLASLIDSIKQSGAPAIFLETGTNPQIAEQIARETGIKVVYGLSSHSLPSGGNEAASYLGLMNYNVRAIVEALK